MGQGLWVELATNIVSNVTNGSEEEHLKKLGNIVDLELYNITYSKENGSVITLDIKRGVFYRYAESFLFDMINIQKTTALTQYNIDNIQQTLRLPDFDMIMQNIANGVCGYVLTANLQRPSYITKGDVQFACTGIKFLSAYKFYIEKENVTFEYFINLLKRASENPLKNAVIVYME